MNTDIIAGAPVEVTYKQTGKTETFLIGELPLLDLYTWIKQYAAKDTPALVALSVNKPREWVNTITRDSFFRLAQASYAANFQAAIELVKNDPIALTIMGSSLVELETTVNALQATQTPGALGNPSSPAQQPSASAAATGSASSA